MSRRNARVRAAALSYIVDHGTTGPAALARRYLSVQSDTPGVCYRQIVEPGPLAGLRLDQRQADAASTLAQLWREALPGREAPMAYAGGGRRGRSLSPDEEQAAGEAARLYGAALDQVQWSEGVRGVIALETAIIHHQPAHAGFLLRALTALADYFEHG